MGITEDEAGGIDRPIFDPGYERGNCGKRTVAVPGMTPIPPEVNDDDCPVCPACGGDGCEGCCIFPAASALARES